MEKDTDVIRFLIETESMVLSKCSFKSLSSNFSPQPRLVHETRLY